MFAAAGLASSARACVSDRYRRGDATIHEAHSQPDRRGISSFLSGWCYAALAYYNLHKDDIDADIDQQIKKARELRDKGVGSHGTSILP